MQGETIVKDCHLAPQEHLQPNNYSSPTIPWSPTTPTIFQFSYSHSFAHQIPIVITHYNKNNSPQNIFPLETNFRNNIESLAFFA
jgi:hypothetical protein